MYKKERTYQNNNQSNKQSAQGNVPQQSQNSQPKQQEKQEGSFAATDTDFVYNGWSVSLDSEIGSALRVLGNPNSVDSQMSCHGVVQEIDYCYDV